MLQFVVCRLNCSVLSLASLYEWSITNLYYRIISDNLFWHSDFLDLGVEKCGSSPKIDSIVHVVLWIVLVILSSLAGFRAQKTVRIWKAPVTVPVTPGLVYPRNGQLDTASRHRPVAPPPSSSSPVESPWLSNANTPVTSVTSCIGRGWKQLEMGHGRSEKFICTIWTCQVKPW